MRILLLIGCFWCAAGCSTLRLSEKDRAEIAAVIRSETNEPVQTLNPDPDVPKAIRVRTGFSNGAFTSSGKSFILKPTKMGWEVIWRGSWDS